MHNLSSRDREQGIALVLTLAILVIATILVVGFASSMRTERQASASMANNQTAALVAQAAVDHAVGILDTNVPKPLGPGVPPAPQNWSINPGQLTIFSPPAPPTIIPLSSGNPTAADANLNQANVNGTGYIIVGDNAAPMRAAWVNLVEDPSQASSTTNRIMGRYAFWVDDENSKINLNTAYGKSYTVTSGGRFTRGNPPLSIAGATFTLGHPCSVDLGVFPDLDATQLRSVTTIRSLASLEEMKSFRSASSTSSHAVFYEASKFLATTFNADPEFNVFGKSRIFIADSMYYPYSQSTTNGPNPYWDTGYAYRSEPTTTNVVTDSTEPLIVHAYLMNDWNSAGYDKIGGSPNSDSANSNPAVAAVHRIANYLDTAWPGYATTFVQKYGKREAEQIAWNIYGMAAAATVGSTTAQQGSWANTAHRQSYGGTNMRWSSFLWDGPLGSGARILPQTRSALISKVGVGVTVNPVSGSTTRYRVGFRILFEGHLPSGYQGFESTHGWSLSNDRIYVVHLEAIVNGQRLVLASTTDSSALKYYPNGDDSSSMLIGTGSITLDATTDPTDGDRKATPITAASTDFSTHGFSKSPGSSWTDRSWPINQTATQPDVTVTDIRIRFVSAATSSGAAAGAPTDYIPYQISPIRDIDAAPGFEPGNDAGGDATKFGSIHLPGGNTFYSKDASTAYPAVWNVMETTDPRVNQLASDWHSSPNSGGIAGNTDVGVRTLPPYPASTADGDESKLAFLDASQYTPATFPAFPVHYGGRPHDTDKMMSSVGWLSCVSTGIQSGKPWRTLKFQPGGNGDPPDWLLMDLFAVPFNASALPAGQRFPNLNGPAPITYMNSTAGKINLNAQLFPDKAVNSNFAPPDRTLPLRALFENMYRGNTPFTSTGAATNDSLTLATNVLAYQTANGPFSYAGQVCEVPGVADTGSNEWEKEAIIRNLGSLITTRSNAFSVWGVAQTVKKNPANSTAAKQGIFETKTAGATADDIVTGEKRFHAIVERHVWPGVDGVVGNAKTDAGGTYNQLGGNAWLASPTNALDGANPAAPGFDQSYNPQAAVIKYKVRFFEYLDD